MEIQEIRQIIGSINPNICVTGAEAFRAEEDGTEYHVFVKCNGTNNISSQLDILDEADYELFKFNKLNSCSGTKLI